MPWWRRDEHEAVDVEAAHAFRHPHPADPWPAGPFGLAPQFEHQRSHLWGAGKCHFTCCQISGITATSKGW